MRGTKLCALYPFIWLNNGTQRYEILILEPVDVTIYGKGVFADMTKDLKMRLPEKVGPQFSHKYPYQREVQGDHYRHKSRPRGWLEAAGDATKECWQSPGGNRVKEQVFPRTSRGSIVLLTVLEPTNFWLLTSRTVVEKNVCCFKPPRICG